MLIGFFEDIYEYHNHHNQQLADYLEQYLDQVTERTIPLFSHMINAHQVWNARILKQDPLGVHDVHSLEKIKELDSSNLRNTTKILGDFDLSVAIRYTTSSGEQFINSIQEILFHAANHHTHHRAQIISDLRQRGIEPPKTDYIFYKR